MRTFYKIMGGYPELALKFNKSPSSMTCESVTMALLYHTFPRLRKWSKVPGVVQKAGHTYSF